MTQTTGSRAQQVALLTQTGPETPMGRLLRRFWQPVALGRDVAPGTARALRILGEDLTLYRGESGRPYVVGGRCAHRCTVLHTGWVREEQIRCMYHGWRFDGSGQCTEMPAERNGRPDLVRIAAYPVHEYAGLVFAYLGPTPVPRFDLPRKEVLEAPGVAVTGRAEIWDCNWFQQIENSLDGIHLAFVHRWGRPSRLGEEMGATLPQLAYEETSAGIRQTATRPGGNVRISDWTFPNNNHILAAPPRPDDPWSHASFWAVPVDDEHTLRITVYTHPQGEAGEELLRAGLVATVRTVDYRAVLFEEHRMPDEASGSDANSLQDYAAMRGQGTVVDRTRERLASSDAGVALLRRVFVRELEELMNDRPTKTWTRLKERAHLPNPVGLP